MGGAASTRYQGRCRLILAGSNMPATCPQGRALSEEIDHQPAYQEASILTLTFTFTFTFAATFKLLTRGHGLDRRS